MTNSSKNHAPQLTPKPNPTLERLSVLVGEWKIEAMKEQLKQEGHATFEWLEEGAFLLQHSDFEPAKLPPAATMIIGSDETTETYTVLYFDIRSVHRVLQMSLKDGVWKMWRKAPDFSQRFTGTFSKNGNTITGSWEKSLDGTNWEHDFDLTYTKIR